MAAVPAPAIERDSAGVANKERLRLWIRLLRTTRIVEGELRERLKGDFDSTLPRFDVMAALFREPDGMLMSDLSRYLLVSNGNVTGIIDRLVSDGYVVRARRGGDRRTSIVRLTSEGTTIFAAMAKAHEGWIARLLDSVDAGEARQLAGVLHDFQSNWEDGR